MCNMPAYLTRLQNAFIKDELFLLGFLYFNFRKKVLPTAVNIELSGSTMNKTFQKMQVYTSETKQKIKSITIGILPLKRIK